MSAAGRSGTVGLGFGPEKRRVTYTPGQLRPTPEDPVIDGLPSHYLLTLNQNMGGRGVGERNKPQIPKHPWGFWEGPETKLSHLTVKGEDGGGGGAGRRTRLSRAEPAGAPLSMKSLFLGLSFESRSLAWPSHLGPVLIFFNVLIF